MHGDASYIRHNSGTQQQQAPSLNSEDTATEGTALETGLKILIGMESDEYDEPPEILQKSKYESIGYNYILYEEWSIHVFPILEPCSLDDKGAEDHEERV